MYVLPGPYAPRPIFWGAVVFGLVAATWLAKMEALPPHFDACYAKWERGQNLDILSRCRKCASFLGLFDRESSHKSPNFLRSRLWRSRNSLVAVPCLLVHEKSDVREGHGCMTFNYRLDNSRKHVVHGEVPTESLLSYCSWRFSAPCDSLFVHFSPTECLLEYVKAFLEMVYCSCCKRV